MRTRPLYDIVALIARIGVGVVFMAHGWQKIQVGITATSKDFDRLGVPAPTPAAIYATFTELLGGTALIIGLALPLAGALLFIDMAGAFLFVNGEHGLFLVDKGEARNGYELVLVLAAASLLFATGAAGRITLDARLFPRRTEPEPEPEKDIVDALKEAPELPAPAPAPAPAPEPPEKPEHPEPRLAADLVSDDTGDTLVAGRPKRKPAR
jgi:putative oxidoreductase